MSICDLCQLSSPAIGCTRLRGEDCLKDALKLIRASATNGDVIKAIFPDAENIRMDNGLPLNFVLEFELHRNYKNWWNSPYKAGDTE